jgi:hypothetical protein
MTSNPALRKYDGRDASAAGDIWQNIAAPIPPEEIQWRQDGRPVARGDKHYARFVAYVDATFVWARLDAVVPGEWDLTLELLPPVTGLDEDANQGAVNFKARLQILGVVREDVGTGKDYKQASSDAFKRAAVRFGVARELYRYEPNWVPMDGDGRYAKPAVDPAECYRKRYGRPSGQPVEVNDGRGRDDPANNAAPAAVYRTGGEGLTNEPPSEKAATPLAGGDQTCPKCGGRMWDNRLTKRNPKAPDYKCRDRACDGVIWPPKTEAPSASAKPGRESEQGPRHAPENEEIPF